MSGFGRALLKPRKLIVTRLAGYRAPKRAGSLTGIHSHPVEKGFLPGSFDWHQET